VYQVILTKIDKISAIELQKTQEKVLEELKKHAAAMNEIIATSAEKKIGLNLCRAEICSLMA
jgi:GTP-binding protein